MDVVDDLAVRGPCDLHGIGRPVPSDLFDCVNKPTYDCPLGVDRAGARCSLCVVSMVQNRFCSRSVSDLYIQKKAYANPGEVLKSWW